MLFSIPETTLDYDEKGSSFSNFHIYVNGVYHCKQRYSQLDKFYEKLQNEFSSRIPAKLFPGKKLFSLTEEQLEERRQQLEKFIQYVSQDPVIGISDTFNDFFQNAQQMEHAEEPIAVTMDVYLMNGNKVAIDIISTDQTDNVLEAAMKKIGLDEKFIHYFCLYLVEKDDDNGISVVRKLQDFESPYLSLNSVDRPHRIVIRKSYWSSKYDADLIEDRIAMNLLYVQIADDLERGWMLVTDEEKVKLDELQDSGSRKELLQFSQKVKFYGYMHYNTCKADYPQPGSLVLMASGDREFNIRVKADNKKVMEGSFKVQRIRSWRLTSLPNKSQDKGKLLFAFEYLFAKSDIRWVTVETDQAVLMSMCMQGMVDEIIREQQGKGIKKRGTFRKDSTDSTDNTSATTSPLKNNLSQKKAVKARHQKKNNAGTNEVFAAEDIRDDDL